MLKNVRRDICFANLHVASAYKNIASRNFAAVLCIIALCCIAPTVMATPEVAPVEAVPVDALLTDVTPAASAEVAPVEVAPEAPAAETPVAPVEVAPEAPAAETPVAPAAETPVAATLITAAHDHFLKKKIAITQFDVAKKIQVDDINNIYDGLPTLLSSRLAASGKFLSSYDRRSITIEAGRAQREAIIQIAGESGAQFIISGTVVDAGINQGGWSLFGGNKKRHIEIELSIYDGYTGTYLMSRRLDELAQGDVKVGYSKLFGSSVFFDTEFGKATSRLIDSAVKEIQVALENVPFSAHIVRVEDKRVFLDAGSDSLLQPGDTLVAYVKDAHNPVAGLNGSVLGVADRAADTITLVQVNAQFSIGELSANAAKPGIKAGSVARNNVAELHDLAARQLAARQLAQAQQDAKAEMKPVQAAQAAQAPQTKEEQKAKESVVAEIKAGTLKTPNKVKIARVSKAKKTHVKAAIKAKTPKAKEKQIARTDDCKRLAELRSACGE